MGPTILFDKSALQGLGQCALGEVGRYFYTVIPHVLLMEILADLSLKPDDLSTAQKKVADIANKVIPLHSIANAHYQTMCVHNLLGDAVPMTRRPAITGGRKVIASDGSHGFVIDVQSENEAVLRWRMGQFNDDDLRFAIEWRKAAKGSNLEEMRKGIPKPPVRLKSPIEVRDFVDMLLFDQDAQLPLLMWFMSLLRCDREMHEKIQVRWKFDVERKLASFAPYAFHCLRVKLIYYIGMLHGVFGTRPSNIVDLEYLCYTPFTSIFCSGDKLHQQLAPLILEGDQSFVEAGDIRQALTELGAEREKSPNAEPSEDSLIRQLWRTLWKKDPPPQGHKPISQKESERIMKKMQPIIDAISKSQHPTEPKKRFPV
jgi:hypothetical protein